MLRQLRELDRHLPAALQDEDRGVHQSRVASRRLREALPVLAPLSRPRRKAQRKLRRLSRALGTVREMNVTMALLDELARRPGFPRDAVEDVRLHTVTERERGRALMRERLGRVDVQKLSQRLMEAAIQPATAEEPVWQELLRVRIAHRARRLSSSMNAAGQMYIPDRLHDVRIATKKLRYALELAAHARQGSVRRLVSTLKGAQDALGRLHDLQILQQQVAAVQAHVPRRRGTSQADLSEITRLLEEECRHLHADYIREVPALHAVVAACSTVLPAGGAPSRRTPVKMLRPRRSADLAARRA